MQRGFILACTIGMLGTVGGCGSKQDAALSNAPAKVTQGVVSATRDWTEVVNPTRAGGFVMGNPDAKVKLIEIGSMTCPHCRAFDQEGAGHLLDLVKTGQVSWEFRNYVRDAFDVTASLIARCNGAKSFFALTHGLYADQPKWQAKIDAAPQAQIKAMEDLPANRQFVALAGVAGFQQWAAGRGLPMAKSTQCLSNENSVDQLAQMADDTTTQFPDFQGTPTFVINGTVEDAATWDTLEPELKAAMGGRG